MTPPQIFLLFLLGVMLLFFITEWLPTEVVALSASAILLVTGLLDLERFAEGFSNRAVITIGAMFILSAALEQTGVIETLAGYFSRFAKNSELRVLLVLLVVMAPLSALMNNTPLVVILMPVILAFSRSSNVRASRLLIPLSYATILGGTCSMIGTSTNLLVDGVARDYDLPAFSLFSITPLGLIFLLVGGVYLLTFGRKLVPNRETVTSLLSSEQRREYFLQAEVREHSPLLGKPLGPLLKKELSGINVLEIRRRGVNISSPLPGIELQPGDRLLLRSGSNAIRHLRRVTGDDQGWNEALGLRRMEERAATITEAIIGPNSALVGHTLKELDFRQRFGLLVLAIHRQGVNITDKLNTLRLQFGDILLIEGTEESLTKISADRDVLLLGDQQKGKERPLRLEKAPYAIGALGLFIVAGAFGFDTMLLAFLAALGVIIAGCLRPREAFAAVDWRILFLIIGMLGLGTALQTTKTAEVIAHSIAEYTLAFGPWFLLAVVYLLTNLLTETVSNNAVAVLMTPIAISLAQEAEASPVPFVIAVMFAASASFATPIGYQTNTYVYGAGGYKFTDFIRVGLPLNLLLWLTASLVIPLIWPF